MNIPDDNIKQITGNSIGSLNIASGDIHQYISVTPSQSLHQIHEPPADCIEREEIEARIAKAVESGSKGVLFVGGPASGKTTIALKLSNGLKKKYSDIDLRIDANGFSDGKPLGVAEIHAHILRSLEPLSRVPQDLTELMGMTNSLLKDKKVLILIDNISSSEQVNGLTSSDNIFIVYTSRRKLYIGGVSEIEIPYFTDKEGVALFCKICPRLSRFASEICHICENNPLAIRIVATLARCSESIRFEDIMERLSKEDSRNKLLRPLHNALMYSYEQLSPLAQKVFRALPVFGPIFHSSLAAAILDIAEADLVKAIQEIHSFSMIDYDSTRNAYMLHSLVMEFAYSLLAIPEQKNLQLRFSTTFLGLMLECLRDPEKRMPILDLNLSNVIAAQNFAWINREDAHAKKLLIGFAEGGMSYLSARCHTDVQIKWGRDAVAVCTDPKDSLSLGGLFNNIGVSFKNAGEYEEADRASRIARSIGKRIGNPGLTGAAESNLGSIAFRRNKNANAIAHYEKAKDLGIQAGNLLAERQALINLAKCYFRMGNARSGHSLIEEALEKARKSNDDDGIGHAFLTRSTYYQQQRDWTSAKKGFEDAIVYCQKSGNLKAEGIARINLGMVLKNLGDKAGQDAQLDQGFFVMGHLIDPEAIVKMMEMPNDQREELLRRFKEIDDRASREASPEPTA